MKVIRHCLFYLVLVMLRKLLSVVAFSGNINNYTRLSNLTSNSAVQNYIWSLPYLPSGTPGLADTDLGGYV